MSKFRLVDEAGKLKRFEYEPNGLRIIHSYDPTFPVVVFMITYHVGSRNEPVGLTGATHFLEHLMFKGTHRFHKSINTSIMDTLQQEGARMNATTWLDRTNYYEMLPKSKVELAFDIESDRMRNLRLDPEDVNSEKTVILNELDRGQNQSSRMLYQTLWSTAFTAHPYHHPTIGWRTDVEEMTPEGLRHFYDQFYWPENATISVIGQITQEEAFSLLEKYFGSISNPVEKKEQLIVKEPVQLSERRFSMEREEKVGSLMIGYKNCAGADDDAETLDLVSQILNTNKVGRLDRELVDTKIAAGARSNNSRFLDPSLFTFSASLLGPSGHEQAEEAIQKIVSEMLKTGLRQDELDLAKKRFAADLVYAQDGPFSVASYLNEAIAIDDWQLFPNYIDRISRISLDEVNSVLEKYFVDSRKTVGYLLPIQSQG